MPFIPLLYRRVLDGSDVVALNLFFEVLCYEMLDIWVGIHIDIQIEIALPCDTVVFSGV